MHFQIDLPKNSRYGLFPLPEVDSDSDPNADYCTMQDFSIGSEFDSDTDAVPFVYMS